MEEQVAEIWRSVLGRETVGVHDNFFDLGGHSLLMAQVHSRLSSATFQQVSVVDLFRYPTVSSLAQFLESNKDAPTRSRDANGAQTRAARRLAELQERVGQTSRANAQ
jgi:hypothetical protein